MGLTKEALKIKDIRNRLLFDMLVLIIVRMVTQIPISGISRDVLSAYFESSSFSMLDAFTGGSLESFGILALSISPYITASIIIELLTIAIPALEEMQRDGEEGRKRMTRITRILTVVLSVMEGGAMAYGFYTQGLIGPLQIFVVTATLTAGSCFLMWLGEKINDYGIGNGISIILVINILSRVPSDLAALYEQFAEGKSPAKMALSIAVIAAIIFGILVLSVVINGATRNIPIQHSRKLAGSSYMDNGKSSIPIKVNTSGVIPVIFASSLMSFPGMICLIMGKDPSGVPGEILNALSQGNWFDPNHMLYTLGWAVYVLLIVFFAYFYTSIIFNPIEVADNLKKTSAVIPGIRPGRPTQEYLENVLKGTILIGAAMLAAACSIPIILSGIFNASVSFGGTSLIIIASVIGTEMVETIKSQVKTRSVTAQSLF